MSSVPLTTAAIRGGIVKRYISGVILGIACFALGAAVTRYYDIHRLITPQPVQTAKSPAETGAPSGEGVADVTAIDFTNQPLWAYGFDRPPLPGEKASPQNPPSRSLRANEDPIEQTTPMHLGGSKAAYSRVDVRDGQNVIDWFPEDHPPMPKVIQHGPAALGEKTRGCASCHLPNGHGRPENAGPAGLPKSYIMRQLQDFRSGRRHSADPRKPNTNTMIELAKALSDEELNAAADYFSSIRWTRWIRVVETDLVPKTRIQGNLFLPLEKEKTEPIAGRIIEWTIGPRISILVKARVNEQVPALAESLRRVGGLFGEPAIGGKRRADAATQRIVGARVGLGERAVAAVSLLDDSHSLAVERAYHGAGFERGGGGDFELSQARSRTFRYSRASFFTISSRRS